MKRVITILFLSILLMSKTFSQEYYELEELFLDAESWFFYEDYQEALPLFLRVLEADSLNYNVMYKIGLCYLHIPGKKTKSIPYLENAIKKTSLNYRDNQYSEKQAPIDALFYLGNAYLVNNKINEAIDAYSGFQNTITRTHKLSNKDIYDKDYLNKQFDACRNAIQFQNTPVDFIAQNFGDKINSRFNEFNAVISGDGSTLVFTTSLKFYDAIFYSKKDSSGQWGYPINLMGQLGIDDNSKSTGLSHDGTELYIYRDDNFNGNIYVSYLLNGIWTNVHKLGGNINTKYWESHASISPDNKKLYFVSNRENDGFGDLDIYVSERVSDSTWGVATNLGATINTRWNENTPFLTPDGTKLFFSSEGHSGIGGYDIFYSELNKNGEWSEPVNIGYPINTSDDDLFFVPYKDNSFAYCSQFSQQGFGGKDIYNFQLFNIPDYKNILVEGIVEMDNETDRNRIDFSINIINKINKDTIAVLYPDKDDLNYEYQTPLGVNHLVYTSQLDDNKSQYFISAAYDSKELFRSSIKKESEAIALADTKPEIIIDTNKILADQENLKIKLSLQKGNKLFVNTFYKDQLINSEEFNIKEDDFIYEYKALLGESRISFKLVDNNNNVKTEEITVSYLPKDTQAQLSIAEKTFSFAANGEKIVKIKLTVEKGSRLFVETFINNKLINTEEFDVKKGSFVYDFEPKTEQSRLNFKLVDQFNNVKNEEIIISHKPISSDFAQVLNEINEFNSNGFKNLIQSSEIKSTKSTESLIDLIYAKAVTQGLSKQQAQALIIALAINSTNNTAEFTLALFNLAQGDLKQVLDSANRNKTEFRTHLAIIQKLELMSESMNYTDNDIINLLENYLKTSTFSVPDLLASMNKILNTDMMNILKDLNASSIDLVTLDELKKLLVDSNQYSETELNQLYAFMEGILMASSTSKPILSDFEQVLNEMKEFNSEGFKNLVQSSEIKSVNSAENLVNLIYAKAAAKGLSKKQAQALIIALAINSTNNTSEFTLTLFNLAQGDLKQLLDSVNRNKKDFHTNLEIIQELELMSESMDYTDNDIINLLENYLKTSTFSVPDLLASMNKILNTDMMNILKDLNASSIDLVTLDELKKLSVDSNQYSETELNQLHAFMEGMIMASNASKAIQTTDKEIQIATKDSQKDNNLWMILLIGFAGIISGLGIIYFNRRRNNGNKGIGHK